MIVNAHVLLRSVDVVASEVPNVADTTAGADVVPVNVTLVVAKSAPSAGERMANEREAEESGDGVELGAGETLLIEAPPP